jgi:hypothetical protein
MANRIVEISVPAGTRVRIGVPAERPEHAIKALEQLFSETEAVLSAKLGLMEIVHPEGKSDFSYTIGIEASSDQENIERRALEVLSAVSRDRWPISLVPVTTKHFTDQAIVFYRSRRKKQNWWSRIFGRK